MVELLQGAGGFARLRDGARGIAVRRALQQVLQRCRQLGAALQPVLSQRDLVAVSSLVLAGSCGKIAGVALDCVSTTSTLSPDDMVALHHIAVDEAEDMALILEPFLEAAPGALVGSSTEQGTLPIEHMHASLRWRTTAFRRLQVVVLVMMCTPAVSTTQCCCSQAIVSLVLRASLAEIAGAWERGAMQGEGLTGQEVQRLVQALFEASDARQRVLALLVDE